MRRIWQSEKKSITKWWSRWEKTESGENKKCKRIYKISKGHINKSWTTLIGCSKKTWIDTTKWCDKRTKTWDKPNNYWENKLRSQGAPLCDLICEIINISIKSDFVLLSLAMYSKIDRYRTHKQSLSFRQVKPVLLGKRWLEEMGLSKVYFSVLNSSKMTLVRNFLPSHKMAINGNRHEWMVLWQKNLVLGPKWAIPHNGEEGLFLGIVVFLYQKIYVLEKGLHLLLRWWRCWGNVSRRIMGWNCHS